MVSTYRGGLHSLICRYVISREDWSIIYLENCVGRIPKIYDQSIVSLFSIEVGMSKHWEGCGSSCLVNIDGRGSFPHFKANLFIAPTNILNMLSHIESQQRRINAFTYNSVFNEMVKKKLGSCFQFIIIRFQFSLFLLLKAKWLSFAFF